MNVLQIVHLAEEYQAGLIIRKCKQEMTAWLQSELENAKQSSNYLFENSERARTCLKILLDANSLNYKDVVQQACSVIGRFGHAVFTGTLLPKYGYHSYHGREKNDPITDCKNLFNKLPQNLKYLLLQTRLSLIDNMDMK